jgi:hypothetical protein
MAESDYDKSPPCPSDLVLQAFGEGGLPENQLTAVADHIASCQRCETLLDSLDQSETSPIAVTVSHMERWRPLFDDPALDQLDALVRSLPNRQLREQAETPSPAEEIQPTFSTDTARSIDASQTESWQLPPSEPEDRAPGSIPERIGHYFIVRILGAGGFGTVYLAKDPTDGRLVAVKAPKPGKLSNEEAVQRFLGEARTAAELVHPGIVQVKDWGRTEDGGCYVVMDYVEGHPLNRLIQAERLSFEKTATIVAAAAEALHYAHRRGVYHRDVKPGNILIGADGRAHVADFGLAISEARRWQHRHEIAGTVPYMAPEQVSGDAHVLDGRTDVYSLGVVLYRLLTGRLPFAGEAERVKEEILKRPPPVPRMVDERVPLDLERICLKCLSKAAADRYSTAQDLADELKSWLKSLKPAAPAKTSDKRRPWGNQLAIVVLTVMSLAACVALLVYNRPRMGQSGLEERWQSQLGELPSELMWPGYRGNQDFGFRENPPRFEVTSDYPCLIRLGNLDRPPTRISIDVRQPAWNGFTGLLYGYREVVVDGRSRARFHAVYLDSHIAPQTGDRVTQLFFQELEVTPDLGLISVVQNFQSRSVSNDRLNEFLRLELECDNGMPTLIRCRDAVLSELPTDKLANPGQSSPLLGVWGVFHTSGTSWYDNPLVIVEQWSHDK